MTNRPAHAVRARRYEERDRAAVLALAPRLAEGVAAWRDPAAVDTAVQGWVHGSLAAAESSDSAVFVAEDRAASGHVLGFVTVGERTHFSGAVDGYVGELVVAPDHERRGAGRALMTAAENWARDRGLRHLTLETGAANHPARCFYAALGYQEEDVRLTKGLVGTADPTIP